MYALGERVPVCHVISKRRKFTYGNSSYRSGVPLLMGRPVYDSAGERKWDRVPLLVLLLIPTGVYFTIRTRFLPVRLFPDMIRALNGKKQEEGGLSPIQTLFVSTATRVGMGNLVGVVAAISAGGAGAVFWMWLSAALGASTAFVEAALAQLYKEKDPLYGGYHGGPAYYIHSYAERVRKKKLKRSVIAVLFALSGLICWGGISQVISNSVASAFENAFGISPLVTTVVLVVISAVIVMRKNATGPRPWM